MVLNDIMKIMINKLNNDNNNVILIVILIVMKMIMVMKMMKKILKWHENDNIINNINDNEWMKM